MYWLRWFGIGVCICMMGEIRVVDFVFFVLYCLLMLVGVFFVYLMIVSWMCICMWFGFILCVGFFVCMVYVLMLLCWWVFF